LNELDQFVKHVLKIKYYVRYCDDFVILENDKEKLVTYIRDIGIFLGKTLGLKLHPNKVSIQKIYQGVDFLGYVVFPYHKILRTKTKRRMLRKIEGLCIGVEKGVVAKDFFDSSVQSYLGMLKHCKGHKLERKVRFIISNHVVG